MIRQRVTTGLTFFLLFFGATGSRAQDGGIEVFAAGTLFRDGWRISESYLYTHKGHAWRGNKRRSDSRDRTFDEHRSVTGLDYGLFPGLTISALIPAVYKRQEERIQGRKEVFESFGMGDVSVLAKYRFYKHDWERSVFQLALVTGLEMPTGETGEDEDGLRLPPRLQPGLGAWNPFTALSMTTSLDRLRFDGLAFYKFNTEGSQDFEEGDFFVLEFDAAYRFWHTTYPGPTASGKLGLQWRNKQRDELDGDDVHDSGSDEIVLRTGLTFHPVPATDLTLSVDVPVYRDFNGTQLGRDVRTILAFGIRF